MATSSTSASAARTSIRIKNRYEIDARVHVATNRRLRGTGRAVVGAYHSHPHSPAWPSASDLAEAYYAEFIWVIVSLTAGAETLKAFRLDGACIVELAIDPGRSVVR